MKITVTWDHVNEEGRLNAADLASLKELASGDWGDRVWVMDFLKDAHYEIGRLYDYLLENDLPPVKEAVTGGSACQSLEHAMLKTTLKGEQR